MIAAVPVMFLILLCISAAASVTLTQPYLHPWQHHQAASQKGTTSSTGPVEEDSGQGLVPGSTAYLVAGSNNGVMGHYSGGAGSMPAQDAAHNLKAGQPLGEGLEAGTLPAEGREEQTPGQQVGVSHAAVVASQLGVSGTGLGGSQQGLSSRTQSAPNPGSTVASSDPHAASPMVGAASQTEDVVVALRPLQPSDGNGDHERARAHGKPSTLKLDAAAPSAGQRTSELRFENIVVSTSHDLLRHWRLSRKSTSTQGALASGARVQRGSSMGPGCAADATASALPGGTGSLGDADAELGTGALKGMQGSGSLAGQQVSEEGRPQGHVGSRVVDGSGPNGETAAGLGAGCMSSAASALTAIPTPHGMLSIRTSAAAAAAAAAELAHQEAMTAQFGKVGCRIYRPSYNFLIWLCARVTCLSVFALPAHCVYCVCTRHQCSDGLVNWLVHCPSADHPAWHQWSGSEGRGAGGAGALGLWKGAGVLQAVADFNCSLSFGGCSIEMPLCNRVHTGSRCLGAGCFMGASCIDLHAPAASTSLQHFPVS